MSEITSRRMGSKWKKAKVALGLDVNLCLFVPRRTLHDHEHDSTFQSFNLSKSNSKQICTICLTKMKQGCGHAIFIAECSHSFHFHCIASNVKPGNQTCPVCRVKWKQIPLLGGNQNDGASKTTATHRLPLPPPPDPAGVFFHDDEPLSHQNSIPERNCACSKSNAIEIKTYPEFSAAPRFNTCNNFTVLVHIKAKEKEALLSANQSHLKQKASETLHRAAIDLVTVLDISRSMAGTKLALLKRAMHFVIQNMCTNDRLSVIAFATTARRLFPLRRMSDSGKQQALQEINSLVADGGTDIFEALRKGGKVMENRKEKNPVGSIMLLSDGHDTCNSSCYHLNHRFLLPASLKRRGKSELQVPVHAFGFGLDHDASLMHFFSEISGGTFSFVENEAAIQDAFAQCVGGLLSVVVQDLRAEIECLHRSVGIVSVKAGGYRSRLKSGGNKGVVDFGDLYADEERDFLVSVTLPATSSGETELIKVRCVYRDPLTEETETLETEEVKIERPKVVAGEEKVFVTSIEVDRQRNRLQSAEAMAEARALAERGDLAGAVFRLENCRKTLSESVSYKSMDRLCLVLDAELKEMQERMGSRHVYEESGRAYVLSGMSSHSWQRATARGDSTHSLSIVQAYQTPSMAEMVSRSFEDMLLLGSDSSGLGLPQPFRSHPKPR